MTRIHLGRKIRDARTGRIGTLAGWTRWRGGHLSALAIAGRVRWYIPEAAVLRKHSRKSDKEAVRV